jgi:enamine deaminase RidA (YjgF/YER057c/UK114 family)
MSRQIFSSGSTWEKFAGYSRAVRVGNIIEVSGTVAINEKGELVGSDPYSQTKFILEKIGTALKNAGTCFEDVVRTRIFTTDISFFEEITKAHGEIFKDIRPACTLVEISGLVKKEFLVEIEASAIIPSSI